MAGRYGGELVMAISLEVLYIDLEQNLIFVRGCIPGRSGSIVKLKITSRHKKKKTEKFKLLKYEKN